MMILIQMILTMNVIYSKGVALKTWHSIIQAYGNGSVSSHQVDNYVSVFYDNDNDDNNNDNHYDDHDHDDGDDHDYDDGVGAEQHFLGPAGDREKGEGHRQKVLF